MNSRIAGVARATALGLAVAARGLAAAGERDADAVAPPSFQETVTVSAHPFPAVGSAMTVVDRATIEASGVQSVAEILLFVPGLRVSTTGSRGGMTTAQVRGGDPNFTLVLLDGIPLNDPTDPLGGTYDLASLPASRVERVEIVRGALSSFHGSSAIAGVVNVVTRRAEESAPLVEVSAEAGEDRRSADRCVAGGRSVAPGRGRCRGVIRWSWW